MPKVHHDRLTRSQSALFVRKILRRRASRPTKGVLVFNSKWLPRLSCVDFQGGSLRFLEGKHRSSIP